MQGKLHEVAVMLLFAKTDEDVVPDNECRMSWNRISVKTLDLNCPFASVSKQLNGLADDWLQYVGG